MFIIALNAARRLRERESSISRDITGSVNIMIRYLVKRAKLKSRSSLARARLSKSTSLALLPTPHDHRAKVILGENNVHKEQNNRKERV